MSTKRENVYMELTPTGGEKGNGLPLARDDSTQTEHDQAVLKFVKRHSQSLKKNLPIGSMIERMHSLGVITAEERSALVRKRDLGQETDESLAVTVLLLIESSAKSAEQRVAFLRVIEESRADGLTIGILRDIWTLLQSEQANVPPTNDIHNAYQPLFSGQSSGNYQSLLPREKDDSIGKRQWQQTALVFCGVFVDTKKSVLEFRYPRWFEFQPKHGLKANGSETSDGQWRSICM